MNQREKKAEHSVVCLSRTLVLGDLLVIVQAYVQSRPMFRVMSFFIRILSDETKSQK